MPEKRHSVKGAFGAAERVGDVNQIKVWALWSPQFGDYVQVHGHRPRLYTSLEVAQEAIEVMDGYEGMGFGLIPVEGEVSLPARPREQ